MDNLFVDEECELDETELLDIDLLEELVEEEVETTWQWDGECWKRVS